MFLFLPVEQRLFSDDLGSYISFGIAVLDGNDRTVFSVSDISTDKLLVADLCDHCNRFKLDPIHLFDVISDIL